MSRRGLRFSSVRTEGGLLPQDVLARIQAGDKALPGLSPESYHLVPHERIGEAVNRAWSRLTGAWRVFQEALTKEPDAAKATGLTRDRWLLLLFQELGYGRLPKAQATEVDGRTYPISHMSPWAPVHLLGVGVDLDRRQAGVSGAAKASPHGLLQEFLNRSDKHLWGFVSNGLQLRVLRDHRSLTRQAYVAFDLQALMEGEQYSDFLLLWMVCHQSRVEADKPADCWLERWFETSRDEGVRALDKLRGGVERAIESFGTGFLAHRGNARLLSALGSGELDKQEYYRQVLRLVYRLIFLFVVEERDSLLDPQATDSAKSRYLRFYATRRLRELSDKRRGSPHGDLWQRLRLVMSKFEDGCPELALPALGSGLWGAMACPWLMNAECSNEHLLQAVRHISNIEEGRTRYPVNWRNVGADELGGIYEGLLELHPRINKEAATFVLETAAGHERKTTGSYYTPTELVDCLLDSALDPVIDEACKKPNPEAAILDLKVCDPACGSGHFLVAAARRLGKRLAAIRAGEDEPSPREVQGALREAVGRCIYGVDVNPMAVELCKVSLWLEAIEPGRPLSFLDSHIQCGNALIGATPALMARGIPDDAFKPIEGDVNELTKKLKARNRKERRSNQLSLVLPPPLDTPIVDKFLACDESADFNLAAVRQHESCWLNLQRSSTYRDSKFRADAWCSAFVWPKHDDEVGKAAITEDVWRRLQRDASAAAPAARKTVRELAQQYRFFHWHLAFPQVFGEARVGLGEDETTGWTGGFDVVLGNPPWERIKLQEKEFFATRAPAIANATNAAARKRAIAKLERDDPALWAEWQEALRHASGESIFIRDSGRYPLCGRGDINTYSIFAELKRTSISPRGVVGAILPSGLATDATTQLFFRDLIEANSLASLYEFENEGFFSAGKGHMLRFALTTIRGPAVPVSKSDFMFQGKSLSDLADAERHFTLSAEDIETVNPNTGTCPIFRTQRDARLALTLYRRAGVLWREGVPDDNPWGLRFMAMLHMANDSGLFRTRGELAQAGWKLEGNRFIKNRQVMLPLYEAKMTHIYTHRSGTFESAAQGERPHRLPTPSDEALADPTYAPLPFYWVAKTDVDAKLDGIWDRGWLLGWRDVTDARASVRTVVAAVIPRVAVNDKFLLIMPSAPGPVAACLYANLATLAFDYCARQKVGGLSLKYYTMRQLPTLRPHDFAREARWAYSQSVLEWMLPRILELTYTAWDLRPFASDCGDYGPPYIWDADRRLLLKCELDAAFFHLYGVSSDDAAYILSTFDVLQRAEIRKYGEFRTRDVVLESYDALANAAATRQPYASPLGPPKRAAPSAEVISFPTYPARLPAWGPDILPAVAARFSAEDAGAWGSDLSGNDLLRYALAAVLRALPEPWPSVDVQRAVILVVWPNALACQLDGNVEREFRRLVGAADLSRPVHAVGNWHQQVRLAISHKLMRVENERWAAGPDLDDARDVALTARAAVTVAWMLSEHRDDAVFEPLEALLA